MPAAAIAAVETARRRRHRGCDRCRSPCSLPCSAGRGWPSSDPRTCSRPAKYIAVGVEAVHHRAIRRDRDHARRGVQRVPFAKSVTLFSVSRTAPATQLKLPMSPFRRELLRLLLVVTHVDERREAARVAEARQFAARVDEEIVLGLAIAADRRQAEASLRSHLTFSVTACRLGRVAERQRSLVAAERADQRAFDQAIVDDAVVVGIDARSGSWCSGRRPTRRRGRRSASR